MAHKKGRAETPRIIKIIVWATVGLIIAIIIAVEIWFFWPAAPVEKISMVPEPAVITDYPLCAGQEFYELRNGTKKISVKLYPGCWSGWVMLPIQAKEFAVDTLEPGDLEYKFWNSARILVPDQSVVWLDDNSQFKKLTKTQRSSFRLRGTGEAKITYEN